MNSTQHGSHRHRRVMACPLGHRGGFTLIELLVVISIIALLIGILLPALGAARNSARSLQCLANVRSMGQASQVFATEHKQHVPLSSSDLAWNGLPPIPSHLIGKIAQYPGVSGRMKDWASALVPYLGGSNDAQFDAADPKVSAVFRCPSDPYEDGHEVVSNISGANQGIYLPISYAVNADFTTYDPDPQGDGKAFWMPAGGGPNVQPIEVVGGDSPSGSLDKVKSTTQTMVYADGGTRTNASGTPMRRGSALMYTASVFVTEGEAGTLDAIFQTPWSLGKLPIIDNDPAEDRHSGNMNIAFADGHGGSHNSGTFEEVYLSPHK